MFCSEVKVLAALLSKDCSGGNDLEGEQIWRPEHKE